MHSAVDVLRDGLIGRLVLAADGQPHVPMSPSMSQQSAAHGSSRHTHSSAAAHSPRRSMAPAHGPLSGLAQGWGRERGGLSLARGWGQQHSPPGAATIFGGTPSSGAPGGGHGQCQPSGPSGVLPTVAGHRARPRPGAAGPLTLLPEVLLSCRGRCPGSRGLTSSASSSSSWGSGLRISDDSHRRLETGTLRGVHERQGQEGRDPSVTWFLKGSTERGNRSA